MTRRAYVAACAAVAAALQGCATQGVRVAAEPGLVAVGHDSRIDLRWERREGAGLVGFNVYREICVVGEVSD